MRTFVVGFEGDILAGGSQDDTFMIPNTNVPFKILMLVWDWKTSISAGTKLTYPFASQNTQDLSLQINCPDVVSIGNPVDGAYPVSHVSQVGNRIQLFTPREYYFNDLWFPSYAFFQFDQINRDLANMVHYQTWFMITIEDYK